MLHSPSDPTQKYLHTPKYYMDAAKRDPQLLERLKQWFTQGRADARDAEPTASQQRSSTHVDYQYDAEKQRITVRCNDPLVLEEMRLRYSNTVLASSDRASFAESQGWPSADEFKNLRKKMQDEPDDKKRHELAQQLDDMISVVDTGARLHAILETTPRSKSGMSFGIDCAALHHKHPQAFFPETALMKALEEQFIFGCQINGERFLDPQKRQEILTEKNPLLRELDREWNLSFARENHGIDMLKTTDIEELWGLLYEMIAALPVQQESLAASGIDIVELQHHSPDNYLIGLVIAEIELRAGLQQRETVRS